MTPCHYSTKNMKPRPRSGGKKKTLDLAVIIQSNSNFGSADVEVNAGFIYFFCSFIFPTFCCRSAAVLRINVLLRNPLVFFPTNCDTLHCLASSKDIVLEVSQLVQLKICYLNPCCNVFL